MLTDEAIALRVQQGRTDELMTLMDRHYSPLLGYLYRLTGGDRPLAEDLAQETFLRVLRGIGGYQAARPFKPWLYAIATNAARNHYNLADTRYTTDAPDDDAEQIDLDAPQPEAAAQSSDDARVVLAALKRLPDHQRIVVILFYYQELSQAEISETLGIPVGTVKSRLSLGVRRLREILEVQPR